MKATLSFWKVLPGLPLLIALDLFFVPHHFRALLTFMSTKVLYEDVDFFFNGRSPLSSFSLAQSARLEGFSLRVDIQLEGLVLKNPKNTEMIPYPEISEENRREYTRLIDEVHNSMLKDGGSTVVPMAQMQNYGRKWYRAIPWKDSWYIIDGLEKEAVLSYKIWAVKEPSCGSASHIHKSREFVVARLRNITTQMKPSEKTKLFQGTTKVSGQDFVGCEYARIHTTVVHVPRMPEPKVPFSFLWLLKAILGITQKPKCFSTLRFIKDKWEYRRVPDIFVSVLFCY